MSILAILLFVLLIVVSLLVLGILQYKSNRKRSLILISIPILFLVGIIIGVFMIFNTTTTDSLNLEITGSNGEYTLKGNWLERYDYYSYKTDVIVFHVPQNEEITVNIKEKLKGEIHEGVLNYAKKLSKNNPNYPKGFTHQAYPVKLQDTFQIDFTLPLNLELDDIVIQYIHVKWEPMDSEEFWIKTYNGKHEENPYFIR